jgi:hypothetical protein
MITNYTKKPLEGISCNTSGGYCMVVPYTKVFPIKPGKTSGLLFSKNSDLIEGVAGSVSFKLIWDEEEFVIVCGGSSLIW